MSQDPKKWLNIKAAPTPPSAVEDHFVVKAPPTLRREEGAPQNCDTMLDFKSVPKGQGIVRGEHVVYQKGEMTKDKYMGKGKNRKLVARGVDKSLPPELRANERVRCVRRFYNNAAVSSASTGIISTDDVFGAILQVGRVSNTSTTCVATSFRIQKVCIYPPATGAGSTWVDLLWGGPMIDNNEDYDRSLPVPYNRTAVDGSFEFRPPKNSTAGGWINQTGASSTIMYLTLATAGSIVDLYLEYTTPSGITASGTVLTHSSVTVGSFYRGFLNNSAGADSLVPIDFTSVT